MTCSTLNVFLVIWGTVEILFFAGIVFGWPSLVYVYKLEGYFNTVCVHDSSFLEPFLEPIIQADASNNLSISPQYSSDYVTVFPRYNVSQNSSGNVSAVITDKYITCEKQDEVFNLIFTLAVVINGMTSFLNGALWDKFGTRFMRIIGMLTFIPGLLLTAFATNQQPKLLYPATILMAYGGYTVLMTNLQLGNLIPRFRSTIISLYCGAYDSSAFVLIFVKLSYDNGVDIRYVFFSLIAAFSIVAISTFWYMPKARIPFPLPPNYEITLNCRDPNKRKPQLRQRLELQVEIPRKGPVMEMTTSAAQPMIEQPAPTVKTPPFLQEMLTAMFLLDMAWLSLMRLQSWSFIGRLNASLNRLSGDDTEICL